MRARSRFGMAMAAMIRIIATTIISSISEKPSVYASKFSPLLSVWNVVKSWSFSRPFGCYVCTCRTNSGSYEGKDGHCAKGNVFKGSTLRVTRAGHGIWWQVPILSSREGGVPESSGWSLLGQSRGRVAGATGNLRLLGRRGSAGRFFEQLGIDRRVELTSVNSAELESRHSVCSCAASTD